MLPMARFVELEIKQLLERQITESIWGYIGKSLGLYGVISANHWVYMELYRQITESI